MAVCSIGRDLSIPMDYDRVKSIYFYIKFEEVIKSNRSEEPDYKNWMVKPAIAAALLDYWYVWVASYFPATDSKVG